MDGESVSNHSFVLDRWYSSRPRLVLFKTGDGKCAGAIQARPQSLGVKEGAWVVGTR